MCPDKFRGSLTAPAAAQALAAGAERAGATEVRQIPLADGGEGTLDALLAARGGRRRSAQVAGPLGEPVDAEYGVLPDRTAIVEMARASGLALVEDNDPLAASTRGTGELIARAIREGARRVIVGVGGSATTDGGLGAVEALGWSLRGVDVAVACDVRSTFDDAARVYGPQKGATASQVQLLERRLEQLVDEYRRRTNVDVTALPGSGAAGGLAGGLAAIGARLEAGFDLIAIEARLDEALESADGVITGEGRLDAQSFEGKVVGGVLGWARSSGVRHRGVVVGVADASGISLIPSGVRVEALVERAFDERDAFDRAAVLAEEASLDLVRSAIGGAESGRG